MKFERFGLGIAKGLVVTFKHLFRHWITTQYPEQRLVLSRRFRGNELVWDPVKCTGCGTCAKSCTQGEIRITTSEGPANKYIVEKFEVDIGRCIFCGLCVESCPYEALFMGMSYEKSNYQREKLVLEKEDLQKVSPERQPSGYFRPGQAAKLPAQNLLVYKAGRKKQWRIP